MPSADDNQAARDFLQAHITASTAGLSDAVADALADGYASGSLAAAQQSGIDPLPAAAGADETVAAYWKRWKPGDVTAADLLGDDGFQALLADHDVVIRGLVDSLLNQLGTILSEGAARGDSVEAIARAMQDVVDDPRRAYTIADTELARAVTQSSLDTFALNGIEQWDWLVSDGACEECEAQADANPHELDDGDQPPLHPGCRCAASPVRSSRLS